MPIRLMLVECSVGLVQEMLFVFVRNLTVTIAVELVVAAFLFHIRDVRRLLVVALAQVATNLLVVYLSLLAAGLTQDFVLYYVAVGFLELSAIVVESVLYRATHRFEHPVELSLVANTCSFAGGFLLHMVL
ncbi:hypothetical protein [Lancefieldella rimae]|uniref:hypothetical protein n=1 Tax=Lancefieldella rimae TaxID=1383 RepID=UPI00235436CE|nr:hypothetical protein [Lancefieldella rimae]